MRDTFVTADRLSSNEERDPFERARRVNSTNPAPNWLTSFAFLHRRLTCACRAGGRVSRLIASPLVSCSRAGLARERAASVNLERIQGCWVSQATFEEVERYPVIGKFVEHERDWIIIADAPRMTNHCAFSQQWGTVCVNRSANNLTTSLLTDYYLNTVLSLSFRDKESEIWPVCEKYVRHVNFQIARGLLSER